MIPSYFSKRSESRYKRTEKHGGLPSKFEQGMDSVEKLVKKGPVAQLGALAQINEHDHAGLSATAGPASGQQQGDGRSITVR
jgi:hypothetical protein